MKKIYEDISRILSEKKFTSSSQSQPIIDAEFREIKPNKSVTPRSVPSSGPPDGLPRKIAGKLVRGANILALADFLGTHGELNAGQEDELKAKRASDPKYKEAERQQNKPRPANFRDTSGIQYDTEGNPLRDPNKEAMATHSAITKKDAIPQASSINTTRRRPTAKVNVDDTASNRQTTPNTYWTSPNQPGKSEPPKAEPPKVEPPKPESANNAVDVSKDPKAMGYRFEPRPNASSSNTYSEPAYKAPEPDASSSKATTLKAQEPKDTSSSSSGSDLAKEYIKAATSPDNKSEVKASSNDEKPEEKSKRVKIIKPSTTSESSMLSRIRNALSEKHQVDEVVGIGTKAAQYGPAAVRFGYKFFRDILKDKKSEVTVRREPAPKPESKPQPQLPPPASAAKVERQVPTSKDVVKTEPKQSSVNVSKDTKTERQVNVSKDAKTERQATVSKDTKTERQATVSKEVRSDKTGKGKVGQKNATQDVVVRQAEPVKTDNVPAVKTDNVPAVKTDMKPSVKTDNVPAVKTDNVPAVRTQTGTAVVATTTTKNQVETEPETKSKLKRVGPPPPPPPVDQQTTDPEPPKKNTFKHGPEPLIFNNQPPGEDPKPQPNNVVPPQPPAPPPPPPPPPPKKGPSLVDPVPQPNVVVPPTPAPRKSVQDCPTGDCDPNLDVKAMYAKLASSTSRGYKESKPKFSMEDTQMNINKKFNVSDNLYQSVMEVMTKAKKPGSVPGNQAERDLAAKHGDPDRITHGDVLVARGVVKSNKPPMKEERDTPGNSYEHQCAIHVKSESFGEGRTVTTQHADPDEHGNIAWYDVMFEHGIERYVPTNELEILVSESHMHSKRKKKGM